MHLLAAKLAALACLSALRLGKLRVRPWSWHFALWKLRDAYPDALRDYPHLPPFHPLYAAWIFPPTAMAMAILGRHARFDHAAGTFEVPSVGAKRVLRRMKDDGWHEEIAMMRPLVGPFIAWAEPVRKEETVNRSPADACADFLVALFSLAAVNDGHERTPVAEFHRVMVALRAEFPNDTPSFDETGRAPFVHSELLSDALHRALYADPPRIVVDERANLVVDRALAMRNLNGFDPFTRARHVKLLTAPAARLVAILHAKDDGPTPL